MSKKLSLLLLIILPLLSCQKEGCIDAIADNHDSDAAKDDGTCTYSTTIVFWVNQEVSDSLLSKGYSSPLTMSIDGVEVGSLNFLSTHESEPDCEQFSQVLNLDFEMDGPTSSVSITYTDVTGKESSTEQNESFEAKSCSPVLLHI